MTRSLLPTTLSVLGLGLALAGGTARADEPTTITRAPAAPPAAKLPAVGVMADVGLPDGAGASLLPFGWGPSLTVEGGHYFDGDANGLVRKFAGSGYQSSAVLERVGYDYANAHLGLDLGFRRVTFFVHAGMSFIRASVHNV